MSNLFSLYSMPKYTIAVYKMKCEQRFTQTGDSIIGYGVGTATVTGVCPVSVHTVMLAAVGPENTLIDIWKKMWVKKYIYA